MGARPYISLIVVVIVVIFGTVALLSPSDPQETEERHPASTANALCAEHEGVEAISLDGSVFRAATCKDGTAVELE
jgi:hypothetical protein